MFTYVITQDNKVIYAGTDPQAALDMGRPAKPGGRNIGTEYGPDGLPTGRTLHLYSDHFTRSHDHDKPARCYGCGKTTGANGHPYFHHYL